MPIKIILCENEIYDMLVRKIKVSKSMDNINYILKWSDSTNPIAKNYVEENK